MATSGIENARHPRLLVLGIGGGGVGIVDGLAVPAASVEVALADSDVEPLARTAAARTIFLGRETTRGLGTGARADLGRQAAEETIEEIAEHFADADALILVAGLGRGTGSGATPVIARAARTRGIATLGLVVMPRDVETRRTRLVAEAAHADLTDAADALLRFENDGSAAADIAATLARLFGTLESFRPIEPGPARLRAFLKAITTTA